MREADEAECSCRGLVRRPGDARMGRFNPIADLERKSGDARRRPGGEKPGPISFRKRGQAALRAS